MNNENCVIHRFKTMRLLSESKVPETGAFSKGINKGLNIALSIIGNFERVPSVDAVEVVRCKNCEYWSGNDHQKCRLHSTEPDQYGPGADICMEPDDFCSYGERAVHEG